MEIYRQLAAHLDNLPAGYPATESGVELRILKRLFTPDEAEVAVGLTMMPEPVAAVAERMGREPGDMEKILADMAKKGLIFRSTRAGTDYYMAAQFVVGIWEYHLNDLDKDLIRDVNEYLPVYMKSRWLQTETKQLRVIPVTREITAEMEVTSYEVAEDIVRKQSKIVVSPCICRREHEIMGHGCGKLSEACLSFGTGAHYYEKNGLGREITQEEAVNILKEGQKQGLVLQPGNSQKPMNICMCCGCCCQVLKNTNELENPAAVVHSNYYARVNAEECVACEACVEMCQMNAITVEDTAQVMPERCIGCGLCVPDCPTGAMEFLQKESGDRYVPPRNIVETYMNMAKERGLF